VLSISRLEGFFFLGIYAAVNGARPQCAFFGRARCEIARTRGSGRAALRSKKYFRTPPLTTGKRCTTDPADHLQFDQMPSRVGMTAF
jgi:hypothetical protein